MVQNIYIIDEENELYDRLNESYDGESNYAFKRINENELEKELVYMPSLIIIHEDSLKTDTVDICNKIREHDDNQITPIIVISSNIDHNHRVEILKSSVGQFIKKPVDYEYLHYTIINIIKLLDMNRTVNPLTGLPGNVQIQAEMKKRLNNKEKFVMLYLDLDNFKSYNDCYGFIKGDEVIKYTANTIIKNVNEVDSDKGFVGHIGGDDFIVIISNDRFEELCQNIIIDFDYSVLDYYTQEDIEKGFIEVENRKGIMEQFPIISISIAVVEVDNNYNNILEIVEVGTQVKHLSKTIPGSTYVVNRRKNI